MRTWLSWESITLPRGGSRGRIPSSARRCRTPSREPTVRTALRYRRRAPHRGSPLAEWPSGLGKGLQSPVRGFDSRFRLGRLAQLGERFPDTEEVTSSSLVPPTSPRRSQASSAILELA